MTDDDHAADCCRTCGRSLGETGVFCRLFLDGSRVSLCAPACATKFLRGPERSAASPHGDLVAELVEEWKWSWGHRLRPAQVTAMDDHEFARRAEPASAKRTKIVTSPKLSELLSHENRSCAD